MEDNVFVLPEVQEEFKKFVRVKLYVEENNQGELQDKLIGDPLLPAYVILKPGTEEVVAHQGYDLNPTTRVSGYVKFLQENAAKALN